VENYIESIRSRVGHQCILAPGVRAVILRNRDEVLLQRRTDLKCWGLPSGSVELNETALQALRREVREETGLEVRTAEPMALYSGPGQRIRYPDGNEVQAFSVAFIIRDWAGTPKADGVEGSEVRFWPIGALPKNLLPIHGETLDDYRRYRGGFLLLPDQSGKGRR
jgi:ADP-ribose pyrophosphatase YjhB (NUDIX family)